MGVPSRGFRCNCGLSVCSYFTQPGLPRYGTEQQIPMQPSSGPSSAGPEFVRGRTPAAVPLVVVPGRSHSVAPPSPIVATVKISPADETGMMEESQSHREKQHEEESNGLDLALELDSSLHQVLDDDMLSARSRLLAVELQVRESSARNAHAFWNVMWMTGAFKKMSKISK